MPHIKIMIIILIVHPHERFSWGCFIAPVHFSQLRQITGFLCAAIEQPKRPISSVLLYVAMKRLHRHSRAGVLKLSQGLAGVT
jgi:hypothetical protein